MSRISCTAHLLKSNNLPFFNTPGKIKMQGCLQVARWYTILAWSLRITIPGYEVIYGRTCTSVKGGVILLIKIYLYNRIIDIDITAIGQIWSRLDPFPGVLFGGFYMAPHDSIYYENASLSFILCEYMDNATHTHTWFGDFNGRLGKTVRTLVADNEHFSYKPGTHSVDVGILDIQVTWPRTLAVIDFAGSRDLDM